MPLQRTVPDIRLTNIATCLTPAVTLLNELHDAFSTPFVLAIANSTLALITAVQVTIGARGFLAASHDVQGAKRNKHECIQLLEKIQGVLYAIVSLYIKSDHPGSLPPVILHHLGKLAEFVDTVQPNHSRLNDLQDASPNTCIC
jgi:hypothetical protein